MNNPVKNPNKVMFRYMQVSDLPRVEIIENRAYTTPWPIHAYQSELCHNQSARYIVMVQDLEVIGYCGFWIILDEAHITTIAVDPDIQGKGYGKKLLTYIMALAKEWGIKKMTLEVRVSNTKAQSLYEKLGFKQEGIRRGYYSDNREDAIIMWVNLDEQQQSIDSGAGNKL